VLAGLDAHVTSIKAGAVGAAPGRRGSGHEGECSTVVGDTNGWG
jgi:hypothetical protein